MSAALIRSKVWFEDGNLIIRAGQHVSRVYRGMLAAKSPIFNTILSAPHPILTDNEDGAVNGCPVLEMPDKPENLEFFLLALFDPEFIAYNGSSMSLRAVLSIVLMSRKYRVAFLMRWAIAELDVLYPMQLKDWDRREKSRLDIDDHVAVINLARDLRMPWLLPSALFIAFVCSVDVRSRLGDPLVCFVDRVPNLDAVDYSLVLKAAANLMNGSTFVMDGMRSVTFDGCANPVACTTHASHMIDDALRTVCVDPLDFLFSTRPWTSLRRVVCGPCGHELKAAWKARRHMFWDTLPVMFGLASWDYMEMERVEWLDGVE
ncbi:hypothetical protein C8J57DRAFT_1563275 [Mycena rebaudengoi]|nr:hypothetical protein C8J57DRAFT_1563275 [Mycena rebaudengoi]